MGIRLAGYAWSQGGSKQIVFGDSNGHIQELVVQQGQTWSVADLSAIAGAPVTSIGAMAGYAWSQGGSKQVVFGDSNGHIQELVVQQGQTWSVHDLSAIAGAPPAINTAIVGYDWAQGGSKQVAYVDGNGHIQELFVTTGATWQVRDLTSITGSNLAATENIVGYAWSHGRSKQVVYVDYFGHIWELVWTSIPGIGGTWQGSDLTAIAGAPLASISSGAFVGYDWPLGGSKQVAYVDDNGHIQELVFTPGGTWSVADLTSIAGAPLANISIGAIAGYAWSQGGTKQVVYVDDNGHIQELVVQQGGAWSGADLTSIAGAPPAISTAIVGYDWAQGGSKQVAYVDGNGHIQELVVQQGQTWSVHDLSAIAGALPANISNGGIAGAPLDLVWDIFDDNEIPMSPKWRSQKMSLGLGSVLTAPNPAQVCPTLDATCTTQNPTIDVPGSGSLTDTICSHGTNTFRIDGHLNWFAATYDGSIIWDDHSNPVWDDDYNFKLSPATGPGLTTGSNGFIELEFQAAETINHFHTPWWDSFHTAVDQGNAAALQMVNGQYAIVTGLLGLDCCHSGSTELHPVWAMAIRVEDTFPNQRWAIFVRNWGNEGFCSSEQHLLDIQSFTFRLPWPAGASSVSVLNSTFLTNSSQVSGPNIQFAPNEGILVNFTLPAPEAQARVNGELTLQGQFPPPAQKQPEAPLTLGSPITQEDQVNSPEAQFDALLAKMTPTQRQTFLAQFPAESPSEDAIVLPQVKAVQVPHLPAKVVTSQLPLVRSVVDDQEAKRTQLVGEALRTAFGGQIPRLQ